MSINAFDQFAQGRGTIVVSDFTAGIAALLDHSIDKCHRSQLEGIRPLFERLAKKHPEGVRACDLTRRESDALLKGMATAFCLAAIYGASIASVEPEGGLQ
ncbi:hypothetical protein [Haloferula sp. A504]|uniref:hypothetical protein n=1 Tax=Haloferula sp. A504 TaxID=3373601 RepID=UPI0031C8DA87|nr:hypothetical protein [Verrucomicrobiaceae bacterium E54]